MEIREPTSENFTLDNLYGIDRWMCKNCGFILDYQFEMGELGWPEFDPPLHAVYHWIDEDGRDHFEEPERTELCPRCKIAFDGKPPVSITVQEKKISGSKHLSEDEEIRIQSLRRQHKFYYKNLHRLEEQAAQHGAINVPTRIQNEIDATQDKIAEIDKELRELTG